MNAMPKTWFSTPLSKNAKDTERRIRNIFEGQRRRPAVLVLALVAAAALLCGSVVAVRVKRTVPTTEDRWEQEKKEAAYAAATDGSATLPAYVYQGDNPYLAAVCDWITSGEGRKYLQAEVTIPCPLIAEIDDSDPQDIRVWGNFWVYSYKAVGTTLISVSGGECPGLLHLRAAENGYEVFDAELVGDGGAYAKDMRRIFGTLRMMKLDAIDGDALRAQYIADYVRWNDLPFTQYQDYGWDPVHIPGTPETPESAQIIHLVSPMGWSIDYDLREFSHDIAYGELEMLTGVGELQGVSIYFERYTDTDVESVLAEQERQMEHPRRVDTFIGADSIPVMLVRDAATRDEVLKGSYVIALNETDTLAVSVSNTYYAIQGDPVVPGADAALAKTLVTFRLTQEHGKAETPRESLLRALRGELVFPLDTSQTRVDSLDHEVTLPELTAEDGDTMAQAAYTFLDLDGDGTEEAVYQRSNYRGFYVLRWWEGKVFGYELNYRGMMELKQDGTFGASGGAGDSGYCRLRFSDTELLIEPFMWRLENAAGEETCTIEGENISHKEYFRAMEEQNAKQDAEWIPME